MPARTLHDSITGKTGYRQKVRKDKSGRTSYEYSNGAEIIMAKSGDGVPGYMKEVREVVAAKAPHAGYWGGFGDPKYDRKLVKTAKEDRQGA